MRIGWLLSFAFFLFIQGTFQTTDRRTMHSVEKSETCINETVLSFRSKDDHSKSSMELQGSLKQTANSTWNTTTQQVTATRQGPCQCRGGVCSCCSRILYDTWKQKACVNVTYEPDEFSFTAKISMNDKVLYTRTVSGKNPRPVCVPVPRIPVVKACVRFYNIYFQGRNIHLCVNMEGKFRETIIFKVGLDCIRFGSNGLALVKPEDGGGLGQIEFLPNDDNDEDDDNYDYAAAAAAADDDYDDDDDDYYDEDDDDDDEDDDLLDF